MTEQLIAVVNLGIIFGILSIGIYLTFRILDFPDLTVDGSFVLGASLASLLIKNGYSAYLSLFAAFIVGFFAGIFTSFLHMRIKIHGILSGILTATILYSINLRIMGSGNISIYGFENCFFHHPTLWLIGCGALLIYVLHFVFRTYFGLILLSVGQNEKASSLYMINTVFYKGFLIALSNGIAALSGAIIAQYQGFCEISMGVGSVIVGLACIMVGEIFIRNPRHYLHVFSCIVIGSIFYRLIIQVALNLDDIGLRASDLKMVTGFMVVTAIIFSNTRNKKKEKIC